MFLTHPDNHCFLLHHLYIKDENGIKNMRLIKTFFIVTNNTNQYKWF